MYINECNLNGTKRKPRVTVNGMACVLSWRPQSFLDLGRTDIEDTRQEYGEERRITTGLIDERLHVIVYTTRGAAIRLISARKANRKEVRNYGNRSIHPGP